MPQDQVRVALIADGAKWIWSHLTAAFPNGQEILDYYHCSEHIHKLAELQYPKDSNRQAIWIESSMARLYHGGVTGVTWGLQRMNAYDDAAAKAVASLIGSLKNDEHRIDYKKLPRAPETIWSVVVQDQRQPDASSAVRDVQRHLRRGVRSVQTNSGGWRCEGAEDV